MDYVGHLDSHKVLAVDVALLGLDAVLLAVHRVDAHLCGTCGKARGEAHLLTCNHIHGAPDQQCTYM